MNKILSRLKYPKSLLLALTFVIAYIIFNNRDLTLFHDALSSLGYTGAFLTGVFFTYGFTSAPATAILLTLAKEQNILLTGFIAGFGALLGDLLIFKFIKYSLADEIKKLSKERLFNHAKNKIPKTLKKYLILVLAGFIISSPLPDEAGVSLLAASTTISIRAFSIISYALNTAGIFLILIIGASL